MNINIQATHLEQTKSFSQKLVKADGHQEIVQATIIHEHNLDVSINETRAIRLVCTPTDLPELVMGRLVTEGIVSSAEDIEGIYICEQGTMAKVFLQKEIVWKTGDDRWEPTCCTGNQVMQANRFKQPLCPVKRVSWEPEWIFALTEAFAEDSRLHHSTAGTHSCYLAVKGNVLFHSEDIGRHNALDKCIGYALRQEIDRSECMLFTTGRVPTDMVQKVIAAGIPLLASKAVPTDEAIALAEQFHLTLICKAWPDSFVVACE